jgi:glycosyltransferase involved in cell wall biosynthesis
MRVLFVVSLVLPTEWFVGIHGIHQRMEMFIDAIKEIAQIDILFYVASDTDISPLAVSKLESFFRQRWNTNINLFLCPEFTKPASWSKLQTEIPGIFNFFKHPAYINTSGTQQIQAFEECLSRKPDAIFVHRLRSMPPTMLTRKTLPPIFIDLDDIEHIAFIRKLHQPPSSLIASLYYSQVPAIWWGELRAIRMARQTFICSKKDCNYLTKRWGLSGVVTVPNAITIPEPQTITNEPTLLFIGTYTYQANINAANFLVEQVWPRIYRVIPEARLIIAGKQSSKLRSYSADVPGVEFTGFVDDIDALYRRIRVVCCPIFSGGGTRIKMIEAAAYGKPIVATSIGVEGLDMQDGQDFLLRNNPKSFAEACLDLLKNYSLCEQLGANARAVAIRYYNRTNIVRLIQEYVKPEKGAKEIIVDNIF